MHVCRVIELVQNNFSYKIVIKIHPESLYRVPKFVPYILVSALFEVIKPFNLTWAYDFYYNEKIFNISYFIICFAPRLPFSLFLRILIVFNVRAWIMYRWSNCDLYIPPSLAQWMIMQVILKYMINALYITLWNFW